VYETDEKGKYICNYYSDFVECNGQAVMLDFNPYNPLSVMSLKEVVVMNESIIKYRRVWKDNEITGIFDKGLKRYHYDVWGGPILGRKYYNAVKMRCYDLVVKSFKFIEKIVKFDDPQNRIKPLLYDPIHVDPYFVADNVRHKFRSNLRKAMLYNGSDKCTQTCLPWNNYVLGKSKTGLKYRKLKDPIMNIGGAKIYIPRLHSEVRDIMKRPKRDWTELDKKKVQLARDVFVQRKFVSAYDGSVVKRDEYCTRKFVCAFVRDNDGDEVMEFVPYVISRYPVSNEGTLITNIMMFTLEEFMSQWEKLYTEIKSPWWLEETEPMDDNDWQTITIES